MDSNVAELIMGLAMLVGAYIWFRFLFQCLTAPSEDRPALREPVQPVWRVERYVEYVGREEDEEDECFDKDWNPKC